MSIYIGYLWMIYFLRSYIIAIMANYVLRLPLTARGLTLVVRI